MAEQTDDMGFRLPQLTPAQQKDRQIGLTQWQAYKADWDKYEKRKQLPSQSKVKELVRKGGVPPEMRHWVWTELSGAAAMKASKPDSYYRDMLSAGEARSTSRHQIELDLPRTFPEHKWLHGPEGQQALRSVLLAYSMHNTRAGYCQGLNFVAGTLLLGTNGDPETAFWLLAALIERILYRDMYGPYLPGFLVEMKVLNKLVTKKLPKLHKHLESTGCEISILATDWFMCIYTTTLPHEVSVRVWDCVFSEGAKVIFRVALALLKLNQDMILQHDNAGEIIVPLKENVSKWWSTDKLLKTAFDGIGGLPMSRIQDYREKHRGPIETMARDREVARRKQEELDAARVREANGGIVEAGVTNGTH